MEKEEVKNILRRWGTVSQRCQSLMDDVREWKAMLDTARDLASSGSDGMPHSGVSDTTARKADLAMSLEDSLMTAQKNLVAYLDTELDFKKQMDEIILSLPENLRQTIEYRYKFVLDWMEIGERLYVDERTARRYEEQAILIIEGKLWK